MQVLKHGGGRGTRGNAIEGFLCEAKSQMFSGLKTKTAWAQRRRPRSTEAASAPPSSRRAKTYTAGNFSHRQSHGGGRGVKRQPAPASVRSQSTRWHVAGIRKFHCGLKSFQRLSLAEKKGVLRRRSSERFGAPGLVSSRYVPNLDFTELLVIR